MAVLKTLGTALAAGFIFAAGAITGADIAENNAFHTETFEAIVIDGEGFYGEPVDGHGEGVFLPVDFIPIEANEGDIVNISWSQAQADNSDWHTPAKVELKEETR